MKWVKLGDYIEQRDERNTENKYGVDCVRGISIKKQFIDTVADMTGVSLASYKIVAPNEFSFVTITSRNGEKISLAMNNTNKNFLVSATYEVFGVKNSNSLLPEYLYLWFCRSEFDRYARFNSWGSAREAFSFEDMKRVEIPLPPIEEQRQIVAVWKGLKEIKEQNERLVSVLSLLCQSYFDKIKHIDRQTDRLEYRYPLVEIGRFIQQRDERNTSGQYKTVVGINRDKEFMPTVANMEEIDTNRYKVVRGGDFVFSGMQTGRDQCIRIGLYEKEEPSIISPAYTTFIINDVNTLLPEFLFMYFKRPEMDRYGWFISDSSVRANLDWERFIDIKIPLPPIDVQKAIVNIYNCVKESKNIAKQAEEQLNRLCPALMRQAIGKA